MSAAVRPDSGSSTDGLVGLGLGGVKATQSPRDHADVLEQIKKLPWRQAELLLVQDDGTRSPAPAEPWLAHFATPFHAHLRLRHDADMDRLARYVTGRGLGAAARTRRSSAGRVNNGCT